LILFSGILGISVVACAPPKLPATSLESAIETYACAAIIGSQKFPSMSVPPQGAATPVATVPPPPPPGGLPGSKLTITVAATLAKEGSAGVTVPISLTGKVTDTRSTTVAVELTRLPLLAECLALQQKARPTFLYDQETGEVKADNEPAKREIQKLTTQLK
jgi:hypothetical protein